MVKPQVESELERSFYSYWSAYYGIALPVLQHRFHPTRKFRFDFAWPRSKVAVEVQGMGVGHCSLQGMTQDYDKHLEALLLNWKIVYLTSKHLSPRNIQEVCDKVAQLLNVTRSAIYVPLSRRKQPGGSNARI
jgi:very-short-patch-repair endonuclease